MLFIDTNIFIRHLTQDDPIKAQACFNLFKKIESQTIEATTSEAIIAEVVYVLSSKQLYHLDRVTIRTLLYPILNLKGLKIPGKVVYLQALDIYADVPKLDFEDALIVALMQKNKLESLYSYDTGFDEVTAINRLEP